MTGVRARRAATPGPGKDDEAPPFFGSWNRLYGAVIGFLAAFILLCHLFAIAFS